MMVAIMVMVMETGVPVDFLSLRTSEAICFVTQEQTLIESDTYLKVQPDEQ